MRSLILLFLTFSSVTFASEFPSSNRVYAEHSDYKASDAGFTEVIDDKTVVKHEMDNSHFTEHPLSMRPFRCLEEQDEWSCNLEHPQERSNSSADVLADLEYQLLFMRKPQSEFRIDSWNGLYYKMMIEADGSITGKLVESDLDSPSSPTAA